MLRKTLIVRAVAIMRQGMTNGYSQSYDGWGYGGLYEPRRGSRICCLRPAQTDVTPWKLSAALSC
jgi:hypothetical protein